MRFRFGDIVESGRVSPGDPNRVGVFVRLIHRGRLALVTDTAGRFWEHVMDDDDRLAVIGSYVKGGPLPAPTIEEV